MAAELPPEPEAPRPIPPAERAAVDRVKLRLRREPSLSFDDPDAEPAATPLRPAPRLGPAEKG